MGKAEAVLAVGKLMAAFRPERVRAESVQVYAERLEDIQPELLSKSVNRILEESKFFPSVHEIRVAAARVAGVAPASPAETQAIIRRADVRTPIYRRDGSFAYEERRWEWPKGINQATRLAIEETLSRLGEPCDANGKAHFGWELGFQKTYETEAGEVMTRVLSDLTQARLPVGDSPRSLPEGDGTQG